MTTDLKAAVHPEKGTMEGGLPEGGTLALVEQAQAAYDAGRDREWAGALWMAGEQVVRELAKARGIAAVGSIAGILDELDRQDGAVGDGYHSRAFGSLMMLQTHYQLGVAPAYWWQWIHEHTIAFIAECHAATA